VTSQHRSFRSELAGVAEQAYVEHVRALDAHGYGNKDAVYRQVVREYALPERLAAELLAFR